MSSSSHLTCNQMRDSSRSSIVVNVTREVIGQQGVKGLWRGTLPSLLRWVISYCAFATLIHGLSSQKCSRRRYVYDKSHSVTNFHGAITLFCRRSKTTFESERICPSRSFKHREPFGRRYNPRSDWFSLKPLFRDQSPVRGLHFL